MAREYDDTEGSENVGLTSDLTSDLSLDEKELDFEEGFGDEAAINELEQLAKKAKSQTNRFSLKARRAIEDHLEERKLRKEMDYLFSDGFAEDNSNKIKK